MAWNSEEMERRHHVGSLPPWTWQADRTSSKLGFKPRQGAGFDAVAHACVARWQWRTCGFHHPKLGVATKSCLIGPIVGVLYEFIGVRKWMFQNDCFFVARQGGEMAT